MVADLYLCWAHYYDYNDNFEKAEQVYQKGLNARAQPIDQLEQAHKQFGFSMSQRMLYKDETTRRNFLSSMDEQRLALTSLRAHKRRHVGSIRTGSAIKSYNPGRVDQQSTRNEAHSSNRMVQVFDDENKAMNEQATLPLTSPIANSEQQQLSIVQTILNSTKKQENLREPGPWTNAKIKSSRSIVTGSCNQKLAFSIMEDDDLIPLPENENMLKKGIQLPHGFIQRNIPQKEFESIPLHRDEGNNTKSMPGYDKFMLFPSKDKCFSLDELNAYKWFKKHNQVNNFTKEQDLIWQCGYEIPIRLPPFFCRINDKQDDWTLPPVNPNDVIVDGKYKYGFDINQIYSTQEYSPEELLQSKWLNGEMISQKVNEMELTCAFNRRESIFVSNASRRSMALGGRKSIIPLRTNDSPVNAPRKSILQVKKYASPSDSEGAQCIALMQQSETKIDPVIDNVDININSGCSKRKSLPKEKDNFENILKAEISSPPISRRRVEDDLFVNPEPPKFNIFEDPDTKVPEKSDKDIFKTPNLPPTTKPRISSIFLDEDQEGCTTQTFNFFIKSQSVSTPKAEKKHSLFPKISETIASNERYQELFPGNENLSPIELPQNDDGNKKQAFNCRTSDTMPKENDYLSSDPFDLVRQKLSAIMETTEDTHTTSSTATISNKSSSAEDFDLTKQHYNPTSSLAVSSQRTMTECRSQFIENTSKASSIAATNNSIMSQIKKNSEDEEIYQECVPEVTATEINTLVMIEKPTNDQATIAEQLTENKNPLQFSIFEDDLPSQRNLISFQTAEDDAQPIIVFEEKTETIPASVFNKNQTNNKSVFGHLSDQTCPSLGPFNFIEEKTDNIPKNFNTTRTANKSCFSQTIEQTIPSINHFNIEEENTETIVKQIANHQSTNRSIFAPKFNQSTFFSIENHTETIPQINDKSQFSVFQDDEAITDQIPEMLNNQNSSKLLLNSSVVDKSIFAIKDDDAPPTMCKIGPSVGLKGESILLPNITQPDILCIADKTNEFQYLKETESPTNASKMLPELTNQSQIKVGEKSVFCLEQEDSYQLMKSSVFSKKKTSFDVTSKVASTTTENQSVTLYNFKTSSNNSVAVSSNTLPKPTTAATDFDDSFYNLINSPLPRNSTFKNPFPIKNFQSQPNAALLKSNQPLAAVKCNSPKKKSKDHSMSLLKPMSDISINASNSQTPNKVIQMTFSEDNPHTALFSLHMPSIQNSTLISMETNSVETQRKSIHIKDEPTTMLSNSRETTPQKWMQKSDQSSIASPKPLNSNNLFASSAPAPSSHKSNAIASFENDFYNLLLSPCSYDAKEQGNFLEMTGIELSEDERALLMKENSLKINNESFPKFQISEPKTIRSSQFEKMTRYTVLDNKVANEQSLNPTIGVSQYEKSLTLAGNANQSIDAIASKLDIDQSKPIDSKADNNAIDQSVYIIEANGDFSTVVGNTKHELSLKQSSISENESKPHQSPFRNRAIDVESSPFCTPTNDKKEINPFDAQLQNAFLQHIDFVDYISKLDNVITVNRARPIQPDTEISFGDKNFQIINMIGKGSFAFVFRLVHSMLFTSKFISNYFLFFFLCVVESV